MRRITFSPPFTIWSSFARCPLHRLFAIADSECHRLPSRNLSHPIPQALGRAIPRNLPHVFAKYSCCGDLMKSSLGPADIAGIFCNRRTSRVSDSIPASNEQILWSGTVSNLHYFGKWILVFVLVIALAASFLISYPDSPDLLWGMRAVLLGLVLFLVFWISLDRSRRKYAVSNKRVSVEFGIISKRSNEVRVQDVRSINLRKTGISGLLGVGTVEFSSAATDDADVIFWNTSEAEKVRDLVRSLQA